MNASTIGTAMALLLLIPARALATPDAARLEHLLTQDCGACHGLKQPGVES
ncbi:cytochrome c, partial [Pseudomonas sp. TNT11]|nr:cytochrome c [Pseudomonas emilianonis]